MVWKNVLKCGKVKKSFKKSIKKCGYYCWKVENWLP